MPPLRRVGDQTLTRFQKIRKFVWIHKLYRDVWLIIITGVVLVGIGNQQKTTDKLTTQSKTVLANRKDTVRSICEGQNANARGVNKGYDYIRALLLAGAALPGDKIVSHDKHNVPLKIKAGRLSKFLEQQGFPAPDVRLARARKSAAGLRKLNVPIQSCEAAVAKIQGK